MTHYHGGLKLCHRPLQHFPETWRTYLIDKNLSSTEAAGTSTSISSTGEKSTETKTSGCTNHSIKSQKPSQDLTVKSSSTTNASHKRTSADPLKSSERGMRNNEISNSGAKLPCTTICSSNSSFKKSSTSNMNSLSSKHVENPTESTINKSPVKYNCKNKKPSINMANLKCNGQISLCMNNKRDKRKYTKGSRRPVKSNNTTGSVKLLSKITNCNTENTVSVCKVQSTMTVNEPKDSSLGSNYGKRRNLLTPNVQNTLKSIVKTKTDKNEIFTKPSLTPVVAKKLSLKLSKSPKKKRDCKKKVSFHLENLKKDSTRHVSPEENVETKSYPPKVRFSVKFQDNTLGCRRKQSNCKVVDNETSAAPNLHKKSGSGLLQICHKPGVQFVKVNNTSEDHNHKTKICNSVLNSSLSPTKTVCHSPKPPSTVKLKKV